MSTNKVGEAEARAAFDAVKEMVLEKLVPKLARLRAIKGSARELRAAVAELNETGRGAGRRCRAGEAGRQGRP